MIKRNNFLLSCILIIKSIKIKLCHYCGTFVNLNYNINVSMMCLLPTHKTTMKKVWISRIWTWISQQILFFLTPHLNQRKTQGHKVSIVLAKTLDSHLCWVLEVFLLTLFLMMGNSAAYFCSKLLKSGPEVNGTVTRGTEAKWRVGQTGYYLHWGQIGQMRTDDHS